MIFYLLSSFFFFWDFTFFIKGPYVSFIHTLIMFKHVNFEKHIWIHTSKIRKMLILKFHPGMNCLHVFFSSPDEISSLPFIPGQISSRQNRVNSKRHFTIDRDDFIPERVSSRDEISRVNTLLHRFFTAIFVAGL